MKYERIATIVKSRRRTLGIDQRKLSKLSGVALHTISNIEQGRELRIGSLIKILDILGMELDIKIKEVE